MISDSLGVTENRKERAKETICGKIKKYEQLKKGAAEVKRKYYQLVCINKEQKCGKTEKGDQIKGTVSTLIGAKNLPGTSLGALPMDSELLPWGTAQPRCRCPQASPRGAAAIFSRQLAARPPALIALATAAPVSALLFSDF